MYQAGLKRAILGPLIVALAGLAVAFAVILSMTREQLYQRDLQHAVQGFRSRLDGRIDKAVRTMEAALAAVQSDPRIDAAFAARDRQKLLSTAEPLFRRLNAEQRISHLYFLDADGRVVLRVHAPEDHGDMPARATLRRAREAEVASHGIELGPYGTLTLRLVAPWRDRTQRLGYVEFGIELEDLVGGLQRDETMRSFVFVYKDLVERAAWERGMALFGRKGEWDRFRQVVLISHDAAEITPALRPVIDALGPGGRPEDLRSARIEDGHRQLLVALLGVEDITGWEVGKVAVTADVTAVRQGFYRDLAWIGVLTAVVGLVLASAFYWLLDRVQKRLASAETRLVETARAAQAASEAKTMFLAVVSHELRTPLNAIIGFSEMMKGEMLGPIDNAAYKGYVGDIHRSGSDLLRLINDILDIARLEGGHIELKPQRLAPADVAGACLRSVAGRARREGVSLIHDIPSGLPPVLADELRLKQILLNLLTNAIKFTPTGGSVRLEAAMDGGMLAFSIADTGVGMRPEDVPRVLDPFVQLADQMTRHHEGAGLGLPLTKNLVELHGGHLTIETAPGRGTTVTATFPLAPANDDLAPAAEGEAVR
ncbi:MAG: ATP-binding protein [Magnetospirillum sp. WYHS-4]